MIRQQSARRKNRGFTLIEVIITITLIAVVGAMLVATLGTSMTRSSDPIFRIQKSFVIQEVMENIIADYEKYYAGDLPGLKNSIGAKLSTYTNNGYCAKGSNCKYKVIDNDYIKFEPNEVKLNDPPDITDILNLLKVTIENENGERLTYVFAG